MIKLIASDMDGTFLDGNECVPKGPYGLGRHVSYSNAFDKSRASQNSVPSSPSQLYARITSSPAGMRSVA